ncbi:hypothetical protein AcW1_000667 [Taiwanofungus camphoratus]|nr:hypothetical protein AcW1_000667 [Antrodia cinnamomea]
MPTASSNPVRSDVPTANDLHSEKVQSPSPDEVPSSTQISLNPHPLLRRREPSGTDDMDDLPSYDLHKTYHDVYSTLNAQEDSADVTDQLLTATGRLDLNTLRVRSDRAFSWFGKSASKAGSATAEVNVLLPSAHVGLKSATIMASSATDYHKEGGPSSIPSSSAVIQKHLSPPATLVPLSWKRGSHTPVPASAVFARKAPPLSLPTLDKYISSLPIVSFPCVRGEEKGKGKESDVKMFAPMDRLASSGKTLADLEHNSRIAPGWKNRDSIFSALCSIVLGVTGSSALASFYSVHGLFDTLQIFALILNTLGLARRVDFSIDMFSPRVDISSSSPHTKRRIWQEAITTLVLTSPDCEIPKTQAMEFKQARDNEYPPYLLNFAGTPGERLVENLKILREIGSVAYYTAVGLMSGPEHARIRHLEEAIQNHFIGPDCYWKPPAAPIPNCTNFFGNAWWIPFPPTLVIHYDSGSLRVLQEASQFELYVAQNSSHHIQRKREIRIALRALDGQLVTWPYDYTRYVGSREAWCCCGRRYGVQTSIHYRSCVLNIKRSGRLLWEGVDLGSGFTVELTYAKNVKADGSLIGLTDDYDLTQPLARFFALNEQIIAERLPHVEAVLRGYRHHSRWECLWKEDTLTYRSLTSVYDQPQSAVDVAQTILKSERDLRVRELVVNNETVFEISYARFSAVSNSALATWWYIFWDDLWRRNYDTISAMRKYASDFNPHYPTSIAYTPLPRAVLEAFLTQRGLLHKVPKWGDFFYAGFLNKMYLRMNDIVFHGTDGAIIFHLGDGESELDMEEVDAETLVQPSMLGIGGGTDYDDGSIRARPLYRWEGILEDPLRKTKRKHRPLLAKIPVWFGLSPLWRSGTPSQGLALDAELKNGRYVLLEDADDPSASDLSDNRHRVKTV